VTFEGGAVIVPTYSRPYPSRHDDEIGNDDEANNDECTTSPRPIAILTSVDSPGMGGRPKFENQWHRWSVDFGFYEQHIEFKEFVRVNFIGVKATLPGSSDGDDIKPNKRWGSRCSPKIVWHCMHTAFPDATKPVYTDISAPSNSEGLHYGSYETGFNRLVEDWYPLGSPLRNLLPGWHPY
jgi:hypothetical protein